MKKKVKKKANIIFDQPVNLAELVKKAVSTPKLNKTKKN